MNGVAWCALVGLVAWVGATEAGAAVVLGPEFQVNTYTPGPQRTPSVAGRADGSFVVTWQGGSQYGYYDAPGDSASGVFLQRFDASGAQVGDEVHVNIFTIDEQRRPVVSAGGDGSFVVVWESGCAYGTGACTPDGSRLAVTLQRFDAAGTPAGSELVVNGETLGSQHYPAVASAPTGEFVVTWASPGFNYSLPGDPFRVLARRFTAGGAPAGDEFQIDANTSGYQGQPAVAVDAAGSFVVVWEDYSNDVPAVLAIRGQRFDATGVPLGELVVASATAYASVQPAVTSIGAGEFVVAWQAFYYFHPDQPKGGEIHARRLALDGTLGPVFPVNSYVPGYQFWPEVASDTAGNFVVAWTSNAYFGNYSQDGDEGGVFAQAFARDGVPLGSEFQVNVFTTAHQNDPAVAASEPGEFVVAWTSAPYGYGGGAAQDGHRAGVFARKVALPKCDVAAECADANPCTTDACEAGVCLNRRQPGCCQTTAECFDNDPCTGDVCIDTTCSHPPIAQCVPCARNNPCVPLNLCVTATCRHDLGRCEFTPKPGCCLEPADCDDGFACTIDACGAPNACTHTSIPDCVDCGGDAECSTGCLIAPETCVAGRCESPPGCPLVTIAASDPFGAEGKLLASVQVPENAPGKGKVKALITGTIGAREPGDAPSRRCKTGKAAGQGRIVVTPGTEANVLLALGGAGARCLAADPDGNLPIDVTVRVVRKKKVLSEVTASRTWRR